MHVKELVDDFNRATGSENLECFAILSSEWDVTASRLMEHLRSVKISYQQDVRRNTESSSVLHGVLETILKLKEHAQQSFSETAESSATRSQQLLEAKDRCDQLSAVLDTLMKEYESRTFEHEQVSKTLVVEEGKLHAIRFDWHRARSECTRMSDADSLSRLYTLLRDKEIEFNSFTAERKTLEFKIECLLSQLDDSRDRDSRAHEYRILASERDGLQRRYAELFDQIEHAGIGLENQRLDEWFTHATSELENEANRFECPPEYIDRTAEAALVIQTYIRGFRERHDYEVNSKAPAKPVRKKRSS